MKDSILLKKIIQKTEQLIKEDDTITCYGNTVMNDCNNRVSPSSIALRELCIYGNLKKEDSSIILDTLIKYGNYLDNDCIDADVNNILDNFSNLLHIDKYDIDFFEKQTPIKEIINKLIDEILVYYWKEYTIPTQKYHKIVFRYTLPSSTGNTFDVYMQHLKQFKNNCILNTLYLVSYRDIKKIILQARDSGGHLDCFGYVNSDTLRNSIHTFISNQTNTKLDDYCRIETNNKQLTDQLYEICEKLFDICCETMSDFKCNLY